MKSSQAYNILRFAHPTGVKGKTQRVVCNMAIPVISASEWWQAGLARSFQCTNALWGLLSMLFCAHWQTVPFTHRPFIMRRMTMAEPNRRYPSSIQFFLSLSCCLYLAESSSFSGHIQVPPVSSRLTASSLVLSFSAISYSGDEPQRMTWQRSGEKKAKRIPA